MFQGEVQLRFRIDWFWEKVAWSWERNDIMMVDGKAELTMVDGDAEINQVRL